MGKTDISKYERKHIVEPEFDIDLSRYERKPEIDISKYERKPTTAPDLYWTGLGEGEWMSPKYNPTVPLEEFKEKWKKRGKNPEERLALLDKGEYTDIDTGLKGSRYLPHISTWGDRGKELLQGVGGGLANIPDLASNYVAAPVTFLGSKYVKGHGKLLNAIGAEGLAKYANNAGEDLQNLSDKYWNQNLSHEIKNSKQLATKNRDDRAAMLRGAGEFATDLIPANAIGTGAKYLARGAKVVNKVASPAVKGLRNKVAQWWKEPKLPKVANLLETPITGKNVAAFAGAGAGHGFVNTDEWGDKKPSQGALYDIATDIVPMTIGASVGQGIYSGIKGAAKGVRSGFKAITNKNPNGLSFTENWLAKRINKGDNTLDENFIKLGEEGLSPFNIYKDNKVPFKIARNNPTEEYQKLLPEMKKGIGADVYKILEKNFGKYDGHDPSSNINHLGNLLKNKLIENYYTIKRVKDAKYLDRNLKVSSNDYVKPIETTKALKVLLDQTRVPVGKGSGIGKLNDYITYLNNTIGQQSKLNIQDVLNQKRAIGQVINSAPAEIGGLKSRELMLLKRVQKAIDDDLTTNSSIRNSEFMKRHYDADNYYNTTYKPYQQNKVFKKLFNDLNVEKTLENAVTDRNKVSDLQKLFNMEKPLTIIEEDALTDARIAKEIAAETRSRLGEPPLKSFADYGYAHNRKIKDFNKAENTRAAKEDFRTIQRLVSQKRLLNGNGKDFDIRKMLNEIDNAHASGLYTPEMVSFLTKNIRTRGNKYNRIIEQDLKNKSNLNFSNEHKDYHHNKYDITKHLHNWPTLAGGAIGATYGSYIGGLIGATAGGALKVIQSQRVYDAMTKKEFVDELIRLGRIPKTEKQRLTKELSSNPVLKTELINILFKKDDEKNN